MAALLCRPSVQEDCLNRIHSDGVAGSLDVMWNEGCEEAVGLDTSDQGAVSAFDRFLWRGELREELMGRGGEWS